MIDIKQLLNDYRNTKKNLAKRGVVLNKHDVRNVLNLKALNTEMENINARLNRNIGLADDKQRQKDLKLEITALTLGTEAFIHMIPNLLHATVPTGFGAEDNVLVRLGDYIAPERDYMGYNDIAEGNGLNVKLGVELAGARFNVMNGKVAKLHRKLINLALDHYEADGYEYHYLPNLVTKETMFGTGQYPKFKDDLFETIDGLYLIPTGEVPLTNLFANKVLTETTAENKLVTHTPCFRKEVGAYGRDTKGIIRQHQFEKVELVRTCLPEHGLDNFHCMVQDIEAFVNRLNLQYRIVELCTKDIGFAGHKAYDFEIWFPHEKLWREIATVTWCHDFQARRMNAKVKRLNGKKELLHTLNGTGLAVGRVLAGLIEQHGEEAFTMFNI